MKPPIKKIFNGKTFRAVFNEGSYGDEKETGHEFILNHLAHKLGNDWLLEQKTISTEERHIIYDWFEAYNKFKSKYATNENKVTGGWGAIPTGDAQSLLSLAYDIYCLTHVGNLPIKLLKRLKNKNMFQGARYELAIASLFVNLDYELEFQDKKDRKHWEFTAIHPTFDEKIAVEVKSRHRSGVLKFAESESNTEEIKVGITRLLPEAVSQGPTDIPFLIFIDINLQLTKNVNYPERIWWNDLQKALDRYGTATPNKPDPFTAIFITNFSYHYYEDIQINTGDFSQDGGILIAKYPLVNLKNRNVIDSIMRGLRQMPDVPNNL